MVFLEVDTGGGGPGAIAAVEELVAIACGEPVVDAFILGGGNEAAEAGPPVVLQGGALPLNIGAFFADFAFATGTVVAIAFLFLFPASCTVFL